MKFRPLHDRVLVRRVETEAKPLAVSSSPKPLRKSLPKA